MLSEIGIGTGALLSVVSLGGLTKAVIAVAAVLAIIASLIRGLPRFSKKKQREDYASIAKKIGVVCQPVSTSEEIFGRDTDVSALVDTIVQAKNENGHVAVLVGPSGVGKSSLINAKNGLVSRLVKDEWHELVSSQRIAGFKVHDRARGFMQSVGGKNQYLIIYDQVEQFLLSAELFDKEAELYKCLERQVPHSSVQHLFAIREEMLAALLAVLNRIRMRMPVETFHFLLGWNEEQAMAWLRSTSLANEIVKSTTMPRAMVVAQNARAGRRTLPIEWKLHHIATQGVDTVSDVEAVDEHIFRALAFSQESPAVAAQILVLLSDEVPGRHAITIEMIHDALPHCEVSTINSHVESLKEFGVIQDRGGGFLELTCDIFSRIVQNRADSVLPGLTVRNFNIIGRKLRDEEFAVKWKNVAREVRSAKFWRVAAQGIFVLTVLALIVRVLSRPASDTLWTKQWEFSFDAAFLPTAFAVFWTGAVVTRYQTWLCKILPVKDVLRGHYLWFAVANIPSVIVICFVNKPVWPICVGVLALITARLNYKLYGVLGAPSAHRPGKNVLFSVIMLIPGAVMSTTPGIPPIVLTVFAIGLMAWMINTWVTTLGEEGGSEMASQVFRGVATKLR